MTRDTASAMSRLTLASRSILATYPWAIAAVYFLPIVSPSATYAVQAVLTGLYALTLRARPPGAVILLYAVLMIALTALSICIDAGNLVHDDAFELVKYVSLLLAMVVGLSYFGTPGGHGWRVLYVFAGVTLIFGLLETFLPAHVRDLVLMYTRPKGVFYGKPITFFYTTYFAASVYAAFAAVFMGRFWTRPTPIWIDATLSAAFIGLVVLTQSRTSFIAALLLTLLLAGFVLARASRRQTLLIACVALIAVGGALLVSDAIAVRLSYLLNGIKAYVLNFQRHTDGRGSLALRLSQIQWALENNRLVLVGAGIGKGYAPLLESWFALMYYRAGLIGVAAYLALWGGPVVLAARFGRVWTGMARRGELRHGALLIGVPILCLCLSIVSLSSMITDQAPLLHVFYFLLSGFYVSAFDFMSARRATAGS